VEKEVAILYAVINDYLNDVPLNKVVAFESGFQKFMDTNHPDIGKQIASLKELTPEVEEALKTAIEEFKQTGAY